MLKNVKVLGDRLMVTIEVAKKETDSGIILTTSHDIPDEGKVVAVGLGKILDNGTYAPIPIKVDDVVRFIPNTGGDVIIEEVTYRVLNHDDIIMVIGGDK